MAATFSVEYRHGQYEVYHDGGQLGTYPTEREARTAAFAAEAAYYQQPDGDPEPPAYGYYWPVREVTLRYKCGCTQQIRIRSLTIPSGDCTYTECPQCYRGPYTTYSD